MSVRKLQYHSVSQWIDRHERPVVRGPHNVLDLTATMSTEPPCSESFSVLGGERGDTVVDKRTKKDSRSRWMANNLSLGIENGKDISM